MKKTKVIDDAAKVHRWDSILLVAGPLRRLDRRCSCYHSDQVLGPGASTTADCS